MRCYEEADIVTLMSTLEGFGMPIVEAQAVGRVVVTSNVSSMPEVAGDGACLVDPLDVSAIRAGIRKVIDDDGYREDLVRRGFENVKRFDPERIAQQYLDLYRRIAEPKPRAAIDRKGMMAKGLSVSPYRYRRSWRKGGGRSDRSAPGRRSSTAPTGCRGCHGLHLSKRVPLVLPG